MIMDGVGRPFVAADAAKRTNRKCDVWPHQHLQYNRYKSQTTSDDWIKRRRHREECRSRYWSYGRGHRSPVISNDYWTQQQRKWNDNVSNDNVWRHQVNGRNEQWSEHQADYLNIRQPGGVARPRDARDRDRSESFRRSWSYDSSRKVERRHDYRRDSDSSPSSLTSGNDRGDSTGAVMSRLSSRDPRLSCGPDYKTRSDSVDSGMPDVTPTTASTLSVTFSASSSSTSRFTHRDTDNKSRTDQSASVSTVNASQKSYNHQTIIAQYREMCDSLSRCSDAKKDSIPDNPHSEEKSSGHPVRRTASRILSVDVDTGLVCGTTVSVEEILHRKQGSKDIRLQSIPLPPCPTIQAPVDNAKRLYNRSSISSPADISQRRILAPKPNNVQDRPVPYRSTTIPADDPFHNLLVHDARVRKDVTVTQAARCPASPVRPSILKNSVEKNRSSKSSLSRRLPSNTCFTACQGKSRKQGVRFSFPSCMPGRRKTCNSLSANCDPNNQKSNSDLKPNKTTVKTVVSVAKRTQRSANNGDQIDELETRSEPLDKKMVKQQLFLSTFGEPVELVKKNETDTDAAAALLLLSDTSEEMPQLTAMDGDTAASGPIPVEFPPVLSPQSPPSPPESDRVGVTDDDRGVSPDPSTITGETDHVVFAGVKNEDMIVISSSSNQQGSQTSSLEFGGTNCATDDQGQESRNCQTTSSPRQNGNVTQSVPRLSLSSRITSDYGLSSVRLDTEKCRNIRKKRSRRATLRDPHVQRDIDKALEARLVKKAVTSSCVVSIRKIDQEIPGQFSRLNKVEGSSDCVGTLLADDVTRSDTGEASEEPEIVKTSQQTTQIVTNISLPVDKRVDTAERKKKKVPTATLR